mmetsp:Transcript_16264/g.26019  ORF Transcript_16264/g.26019 Transcript_16264/m.26019 type:complete len:115 (-) Transcript_16264:146-490(-)
MLKERSLKREAIKKFKASRSYVSPSITGRLPAILLPEEIDGTIESTNKLYLSGRIDPADEVRDEMLELGWISLKDLSEEERRRIKAKRIRKLPKGSRFYKEDYHRYSNKKTRGV